jgi:hypothetical protein
MQLLTSALTASPPQPVVWISCTTAPVFPAHLPLERVTHYLTPTLSHLLALLLHAPARLPADFALLVVDDISALFTAAFPPGSEQKGPKSSRRFPLMVQLITELGKLAASRPAVVALGVHMNTRVVKGFGGVLQSALAAPQWTAGLAVRLAVLRRAGGREVRVVKVGGKDVGEAGVHRCKVVVGKEGWSDVDNDDEEAALEILGSQIRAKTTEPHHSPPPPLQPRAKTALPSSLPPPPPLPQTLLQSAAAPPPPLSTGKRKRAPTGIAAGIIPDSDDDGSDDELVDELMGQELGWGDDGIFEIGEKGVVVEEEGVLEEEGVVEVVGVVEEEGAVKEEGEVEEEAVVEKEVVVVGEGVVGEEGAGDSHVEFGSGGGASAV